MDAILKNQKSHISGKIWLIRTKYGVVMDTGHLNRISS